jgi:membrane protease YdiL (CAAX protease family)
MAPTLEILTLYLLRVAPGLGLAALLFWLLRPDARLRVVLYVALFVLLRDAMTPLGLWSFGAAGFFWLRLSADPWLLVLLATSCLGLCLGLYYLDRANQRCCQWLRSPVLPGLFGGLAGALIVVAPLVLAYQYIPLHERGGPVPMQHLPALLLFALLGNLWEELLFRGYVYGQLAQQLSPLQAGLASGVVFAFCHVYLATTVTGVGYPLLIFTLWEGILAGLVGAKFGILPATLTHGGAIFLLSSGLF